MSCQSEEVQTDADKGESMRCIEKTCKDMTHKLPGLWEGHIAYLPIFIFQTSSSVLVRLYLLGFQGKFHIQGYPVQ